LEPGNVVNATGEKFRALNDEDVLAEMKVISDRADGTIKISDMPIEAGEDYYPMRGEKVSLECRKFSGNIDRRWRVSSFSSLVSGRPHSAELADHDTMTSTDIYGQKDFMESGVEKEPSAIFSFPKGIRTGTLLHDIFEHLDFAQKNPSPMEELVADKLREYGFELTWQETLCDMVRKVLSLPLVPGNRGFSLSQVRNQDRLNELEFYFPLKSISPKLIKRIFKDYAGPEVSEDFPERLGRLNFSLVKGFMRGFMDMVFQFEDWIYLVDWKSNFLGSKVEDYDRSALALAMEEEFYVLQYHIYVVALNQYLSVRMPGYRYEQHFGGVYYLFLRGVDPGRGAGYGIYRDRPSGELINQLCTNLINRV
jgi:exodeoxyribonuclease V beta subunit